MPNTRNNDLAKKAEAMQDSGVPRCGPAGPPEVRARHVEATNDGYATGPTKASGFPHSHFPTNMEPFERLTTWLARTGCSWSFIEARIGVSIAVPNSSSWSCLGRCLKETGFAWRRLATTLKRPSRHSQRNIRLDIRFFPIAPARRSAASAF